MNALCDIYESIYINSFLIQKQIQQFLGKLKAYKKT